MLITREADYALRMLRVLLDEEKHSAAEMAETELIPMQFAYQILRKLSAGELVQVSRGAAGGCRLSCDLRGVSLYDLMAVMGEHDVLCACMEPGYDCRWQSEHGKCAIHCQLTERRYTVCCFRPHPRTRSCAPRSEPLRRRRSSLLPSCWIRTTSFPTRLFKRWDSWAGWGCRSPRSTAVPVWMP